MWDSVRRYLREQRRLERNLPPVHRLPAGTGGPLSASQLRLWRLEQATAARVLGYNVTYPLRLLGELDRYAMSWAAAEVMRRHEALRTAFRDTPAGPVQLIGPVDGSPIVFENLTGVESNRVERWLSDAAMYRFDLSRGVPFRIWVGRIAIEDHVALVAAHHMVLDGGSLAVVLRELGELYTARLTGLAVDLPAPRRQLCDFTAWQRGWLDTPLGQAHRSYWCGQLTHPAFADVSQFASAGTAGRDYAGGRAHQQIPRPVCQRIDTVATREHVSVAAVYLAAYQAVLHLSMNRRYLVTGIPAANRGRPELAAVVGFLANVLPVVSELSPGQALRQAVRQAEEQIGGAYAHQAMPIEHLAPVVLAGMDPTALPIHTFFAAYRRVLSHPLRLRGITVGPQPRLHTKDAEFPLMMTVLSGPDETTAMLSYGTWSASAAQAEALVADYVGLLDRATEAPDAPLRAVWADVTK